MHILALSAILGLMLFTLTIVVFPVPVYEKAYSCLAVVSFEYSARLFTSPIPITSHTILVSVSSSSRSCMCSSLSRVLTLYVTICSLIGNVLSVKQILQCVYL